MNDGNGDLQEAHKIADVRMMRSMQLFGIWGGFVHLEVYYMYVYWR